MATLEHGGLVVARQLAAEGVEVIFTLTGGHISPIYEGCKREGIRIVDVRHEQAAVHAADGYARISRRPGVAIVTAGPGVAGAVTGIANAMEAGSPVVVLAGRNPLSTQGLGDLQDMKHVDVVSPICKRVETALELWRVPDVIASAFSAATSPRFGPAFVDLPMDVLMARIHPSEAPPVEGCRFTHLPGADPDAVERAARLLARAERPVVFAGSGAYWCGAEEPLRILVETGDFPVCVNGMARGILPSSHKNLIRLARRPALAEADLIVALGVDFDFRLGFGRTGMLAPNVRVVHVTPEPAKVGFNRSVKLGIASDVRLFLQALLTCQGEFARPRGSDWLAHLRRMERSLAVQQQQDMESDAVPIHPMRLVADISRFAKDDAIFIGDGGDIVAMAAGAVRPNAPGHWMDPGPFGCLGVGAPFAMGARVSRPDAQIILILGDGSFGFNGFEFESAARQRLPFVGVIGNDGAWGEMRTFHEDVFGPNNMEAQYLSQETRYEQVVEGLGGYGRRVERPEEIIPSLKEAYESGGPALVNVIIDPTYRRQNRTISGAAVAAAFGEGDPDAFKNGTRGVEA